MGYFKYLLILLSLPLFSKGANIYVNNTKSGTTGVDSGANAIGTLAVLNNKTLAIGDTVFFKSGQTFYGQLIIHNSGVAGQVITYKTYGGTEMAHIIGTTALGHWRSTARTNIWISDDAFAISDLNMVTVDNIPVQMGRWPNYTMGKTGIFSGSTSWTDGTDGGYNHISTAKTGSGSHDTIRQNTGSSERTLGNDPAPSHYIGMTIWYKPKQFWFSNGTITNYLLDSTIVYTPNDGLDPAASVPNSSGSWADKNDWGYFLQNDSTLLDLPNEWYYNPATSKLEIYSVGMPSNVAAASLIDLVYSTGKSYITFDNLDFNGANRDVLHIGGSSSKYFTIKNCIVQNAGRNGICDSSFGMMFTNNSLLNCLARGFDDAPLGDSAVIRYNYMNGFGMLAGHGGGMLQDGHAAYSCEAVYIHVGTDKTIIEFNEMHNAGYSLTHWSRSDSIRENHNFIDSCCRLLADGGNIYVYNGGYAGGGSSGETDTTKKGRTLIGNISINPIGNLDGTNGTTVPGAGVAALYCDKGTNNIIIDSNVLANGEKGLFMNYGCANLYVRNNLMYSNDHQLQINTRASDVTRRNVINNNILFSTDASQQVIHMFSFDTYPLLVSSPAGNFVTSMDFDYLLRPTNSTTPPDSTHLIHYQSDAGSDDITYVEMRNKFSRESNSIFSTLNTSNQTTVDTTMKVVFNTNTTPQTFTLDNKYITVKGGVALNTGSVVLQPFRFELLKRTAELDPGSSESDFPAGSIFINRFWKPRPGGP